MPPLDEEEEEPVSSARDCNHGVSYGCSLPCIECGHRCSQHEACGWACLVYGCDCAEFENDA